MLLPADVTDLQGWPGLGHALEYWHVAHHVAAPVLGDCHHVHRQGQGGQVGGHRGIQNQGSALGLHLVALFMGFRGAEPGRIVQAGFEDSFPANEG